MRYITITTWEIADGADYDADYDVALRAIEEKRLPALKSFGASRVTVVRTSERTSAAITEWPDKATRDAAELKIARGRVCFADTLAREAHNGDLRADITSLGASCLKQHAACFSLSSLPRHSPPAMPLL